MLSNAIVLLLGVVAVVLLLPTLSDVISATVAAFRRRQAPGPPVPQRLLFLVPAHDEELLLGACLESIAAQKDVVGRIETVVIADNCTDRTADIARGAGVRCLERRDATHRGKPHAIAWALEQVNLAAYDGVVIVDADTVLDPGFAAALVAGGPVRDRAVQPFNDVQNRADNAITRMAALYSMATHGLSFRLKRAAGLNVPLSAGMCVGTDVLRANGWKAFSLSEDWEMYAVLTLRGVRIVSEPDARIFAQEARSLVQSTSQRRRWMAGKIDVCVRYLGSLLTARGVPTRQRLDAVAELSAVGPAVHLGIVGAGGTIALLFGGAAGTWVALALVASLARIGLYTTIAVVTDREPLHALGALVFLPPYAVWRVLVALTTLLGASRGPWVRTARHTGAASGSHAAPRQPM